MRAKPHAFRFNANGKPLFAATTTRHKKENKRFPAAIANTWTTEGYVAAYFALQSVTFK